MKGFIIFIIVLPLLILLIFRRRKAGPVEIILPGNYRALLRKNVSYYRQLNDADKLRFENRIKEFLSYVRIHGVNIEIDDLDKLLVASSAIIPVFGFDWHYYNVKDVLLYADTFNSEEFSVTAKERNVSGMVGTGAMQQMMILFKEHLSSLEEKVSDHFGDKQPEPEESEDNIDSNNKGNS